jgi:hypothetical protein
MWTAAMLNVIYVSYYCAALGIMCFLDVSSFLYPCSIVVFNYQANLLDILDLATVIVGFVVVFNLPGRRIRSRGKLSFPALFHDWRAFSVAPLTLLALLRPFLPQARLLALQSVLLRLFAVLLLELLFSVLGCLLVLFSLHLLVHHAQPFVLAPPACFVDVELARAGTSTGALDIGDNFGRCREKLADC